MSRIFLRYMSRHQTGVITRITADGERGRRIREMGLTPGASIEIMGRAPLKDPVAVKVRGCTISLRNNEADCIEVERAETA